jgi:hypothetical protein
MPLIAPPPRGAEIDGSRLAAVACFADWPVPAAPGSVESGCVESGRACADCAELPE